MTEESDQSGGLINEFEAAGELDVSVSTLRKWRITGKGPKFIRLSPRCIRYRRDWLEKYADARAYTSTSQYPEPDAKTGAAAQC